MLGFTQALRSKIIKCFFFFQSINADECMYKWTIPDNIRPLIEDTGIPDYILLLTTWNSSFFTFRGCWNSRLSLNDHTWIPDFKIYPLGGRILSGIAQCEYDLTINQEIINKEKKEEKKINQNNNGICHA